MSKSRIDLLKEYLAADPSDSFSRYALALEYAKEGRAGEATKLLEDLISQNRDYLAGYYQLGKLYEAGGDISLAIETYKKGMEIAGEQKDIKTKNELQSALDMIE